MKRFLALTTLILLCLLAGCGPVAEEIPLVPLDPTPDVVDVVTPTPDMENTTPEGEDETPPLPVHVHDFADATCTEARTCPCGETEGEAKGHSWNDATCTQPKTCKDCGKTEGAVASHDYENGKCTACGDEVQAPAVENMVWIPKSGTKYHATASCSNMKNPTEVTREEAIQRNFTPCKKCYK